MDPYRSGGSAFCYFFTLAVLGQRDLYRPPIETNPLAQERAYLDYDYSSEDVEYPSVNVNRDRARPQPERPPTNINTYYETNCKAKERTLPHEKYCDHFYQLNGCDDDQAILRACPNGLVYTGNGRHGLIGVCDYPHRADCNGRERHSKCYLVAYFFSLQPPNGLQSRDRTTGPLSSQVESGRGCNLLRQILGVFDGGKRIVRLSQRVSLGG